MLADVACNLLTLMMMSVHQNPLDQIVAVLITRDVDEWDARTIWMCSGDDSKIAFKKLDASNLQAFLDNLGGELIYAVTVGIDEDVIDDSALICGGPVFAKMLNAPVSELAMGNEVDVRNNFFDCRSLKRW